MEQDKSLTKTMRVAGTVSLVASGLVFLLQGLADSTFFERFLYFAGLTGVLSGLGLYFGIKMKETKSARTFLGLAAAATPVLFAQLGAMLHTFSGNQRVPGFAADYFQVDAPGMAIVSIATGLTLLIMSPVLYLGFGAFFRAQAKNLVLFLVGGCLFLLVPSRNPDITAILITIQTLALIGFGMKLKQDESAKSEKESKIAMLLPVIPMVILIGRTLFYEPTAMFAASAFAWLAAFFYMLDPEKAKVPSTTFASMSWYFFTSEVINLLHLSGSVHWMISVYIPAVLILVNERKFGHQSFLVFMAKLFAVAAPVVTMFGAWNFAGGLMMTVAGLSAAMFGFEKRSRTVFLSGVFSFGLGTLYFIQLSMTHLLAHTWLSLAILGVTVIMGAGWLEKNRGKLENWKLRWHERFQ